MPPAARILDQTAHGTPLMPLTGSGSPNVLIGGMPAWRVGGDFHSCPLTSGTVPHLGGTATGGSSTVLINNMPAARVGDTVTENGPSNSIVAGETTVLIG